mmetsp:Transcript_7627/g.16399  ORF Transcript_7627/g.16399 Transcript_7627/m.16399 type:complete len:437 (-) Transcript_7627:17-1327(-)
MHRGHAAQLGFLNHHSLLVRALRRQVRRRVATPLRHLASARVGAVNVSAPGLLAVVPLRAGAATGPRRARAWARAGAGSRGGGRARSRRRAGVGLGSQLPEGGGKLRVLKADGQARSGVLALHVVVVQATEPVAAGILGHGPLAVVLKGDVSVVTGQRHRVDVQDVLSTLGAEGSQRSPAVQPGLGQHGGLQGGYRDGLQHVLVEGRGLAHEGQGGPGQLHLLGGAARAHRLVVGHVSDVGQAAVDLRLIDPPPGELHHLSDVVQILGRHAHAESVLAVPLLAAAVLVPSIHKVGEIRDGMLHPEGRGGVIAKEPLGVAVVRGPPLVRKLIVVEHIVLGVSRIHARKHLAKQRISISDLLGARREGRVLGGGINIGGALTVHGLGALGLVLELGVLDHEPPIHRGAGLIHARECGTGGEGEQQAHDSGRTGSGLRR